MQELSNVVQTGMRAGHSRRSFHCCVQGGQPLLSVRLHGNLPNPSIFVTDCTRLILIHLSICILHRRKEEYAPIVTLCSFATATWERSRSQRYKTSTSIVFLFPNSCLVCRLHRHFSSCKEFQLLYSDLLETCRQRWQRARCLRGIRSISMS